MSFSYAQNVDHVELIDSRIGMEKKKMIIDFLDFTESEKASFWPVYHSYENSIRYIEKETLELILHCSDETKSIENDVLDRYAKKILQNDLLLAKVRKEFYGKFYPPMRRPALCNLIIRFE